MKKLNVILIFLLLFCFNYSFAQSNYFISNRINLEGDSGWDYLFMDESSGKLFVSHGIQVQIVDVMQKKVIGTISELKGVHGVAIATEFNKGFITNGRDTSVTIFDLNNYTTISKVTVTGANPDALIYDSFSKKVFVFNGRSSNATVIDANKNTVVETIPLDGKPEFCVSDGKGKVFVNIEDKNEISVINSSTLKVEKSWPILPGEEPSGLAIDNTNHRLFTVCGNKILVVVDADNGNIITTLPIGDGVDGVAFDPVLNRIYSSNGEGTVTIIQEENENSFKVIETATTQKGARTIAVDIKTHHIYLPCAEYGETPEKTNDNPHPRPPIKPGTFMIIDLSSREF
jgi:YVTN family beta-propeller protein